MRTLCLLTILGLVLGCAGVAVADGTDPSFRLTLDDPGGTPTPIYNANTFSFTGDNAYFYFENETGSTIPNWLITVSVTSFDPAGYSCNSQEYYGGADPFNSCVATEVSGSPDTVTMYFDGSGNGIPNDAVFSILPYGFTTGDTFTATVVPEPASIALFASGLLGLAGLARRRFQK